MSKISMNEWVKFNRKENPVHVCIVCACTCMCISQCALLYAVHCAVLLFLFVLCLAYNHFVHYFFISFKNTLSYKSQQTGVCFAYVNDISSTFDWRQHDRSMYIVHTNGCVVNACTREQFDKEKDTVEERRKKKQHAHIHTHMDRELSDLVHYMCRLQQKRKKILRKIKKNDRQQKEKLSTTNVFSSWESERGK